MQENKKYLLGMTLGELKESVSAMLMSKFTASQIAKWLYVNHVKSIDEMTNISKANRDKLETAYGIGCMPNLESQKSKDGTIKYLFPTGSGHYVETVYIPDKDRATLCVSCQVGCKMNCMFCQTGKQGFNGNLTATEILNDADGYAWSPKRITVSSVGVKNKLKRFLDESECHVAISMHSPIHEQREMMMPAEKGFAIADVVQLLRDYDFSHQRRLSFEYIVFGGINDTNTHAREIVKLLKGLDCRVNLIRFHKIPGVDLHESDEKRMERLRDYLTAHGIFTTIRASRGQDIFAACGLLSTAKQERGE